MSSEAQLIHKGQCSGRGGGRGLQGHSTSWAMLGLQDPSGSPQTWRPGSSGWGPVRGSSCGTFRGPRVSACSSTHSLGVGGPEMHSLGCSACICVSGAWPCPGRDSLRNCRRVPIWAGRRPCHICQQIVSSKLSRARETRNKWNSFAACQLCGL